MTGYFDALNYSLGDEDSTVEMQLLPEGVDQVVAIAGSGGRVIPLLARYPANLLCVDISPRQLYLTELRLETCRRLHYDEFMRFWGFPPSDFDVDYTRKLLPGLDLSGEARAFAGELLLHDPARQPLIYQGRFEKTLQTLSRLNRLLTGDRGRGIFDCDSLPEQREYYRKRFPHLRWKLLLLVLANSAVLNYLLYRGQFPRKNIPGSTYGIYRRIFARLLERFPARESYFLQMVFFGRIVYPEGNPVESQRPVFERAKQALSTAKVSLVHEDAVSALQRIGNPVGYLALSDVPSFLPAAQERGFLAAIHPRMRRDGLVVCRGHLRVAQPDLEGYEDVSGQYSDLTASEKTQLWTIKIYKAA